MSKQAAAIVVMSEGSSVNGHGEAISSLVLAVTRAGLYTGFVLAPRWPPRNSSICCLACVRARARTRQCSLWDPQQQQQQQQGSINGESVNGAKTGPSGQARFALAKSPMVCAITCITAAEGDCCCCYDRQLTNVAPVAQCQCVC